MQLRQILVLVFLLLSALIAMGCSKEDEITGNAVFQASVLNVVVRTENGTLVEGAQIYLNEKPKGVTAKHGSGKGSKKVVLDGPRNVIRVGKEGYSDPDPTTISASYRGEQAITFILEPLKTGYLVFVREHDDPLPQAIVSLHDGIRVVKEYITDDEGIAAIGEIRDGNYSVTVSKPGFLTNSFYENINFTEDGNLTSTIIVLSRLPYFTITVTDTSGEPLSAAEVTLYLETNYNAPRAPALHVTYSPPDGKVYFNDVESGELYVIIVKKAGYKAQTILRTLNTVEDQSLSVVLEQG